MTDEIKRYIPIEQLLETATEMKCISSFYTECVCTLKTVALKNHNSLHPDFLEDGMIQLKRYFRRYEGSHWTC